MATQLRDGVRRIPCRGVNAYLVDDGPTLIDAGTPWDATQIQLAVARTDHDLADVERVLVTHYDVDHVGALADLADRGLAASVHAAEPDASHLAGRTRPRLASRKGLVQRALAPLVEVPELDVERVTDGDAVGPFDVYHTPGHTPGHVAYVHDERSTAFVGDLVRERDGRLRASPWALSHDAAAVRESIQDLADRAPAFETLAPGHGDPIGTGGSVALARLAEAAARRP